MDKPTANDVPVKIVFRHEGKDYPLVVEKHLNPWWDEHMQEWDWYLLEEGNYGCQCNRSILIHEKYPEFPLMECGESIELIDYDFVNPQPTPMKSTSGEGE